MQKFVCFLNCCILTVSWHRNWDSYTCLNFLSHSHFTHAIPCWLGLSCLYMRRHCRLLAPCCTNSYPWSTLNHLLCTKVFNSGHLRLISFTYRSTALPHGTYIVSAFWNLSSVNFNMNASVFNLRWQTPCIASNPICDSRFSRVVLQVLHTRANVIAHSQISYPPANWRMFWTTCWSKLMIEGWSITTTSHCTTSGLL